jgi:hypothetical protein
MDPITIFATATAAYNAVKKGIEVGRELSDMGGQLGQWFTAVADFNATAERKAKPPLFKKLLSSGSVESEALQITLHKQKILEMEKELRELIMYRFGGDVYQQMMQERRRIRDQREQEIHAQKRRQEAFIENSLYLAAIAVCVALMGWAATWFIEKVQ